MEAHNVISAPVTEHVLRAVYASDQDMHPAPLPYERLHSWLVTCPDLSICFARERAATGKADGSLNATTLGVIIALPVLRPHWENLLRGQLKETDIDPGVAFPHGEDGTGRNQEEEVRDEVGLHIFHVERFPGWESVASVVEGGFAAFALGEILRRASSRRTPWKIVGLSGM